MRTQIIADISSNHMGDMRLAEALIAAAADVGVDTVKFQSWQASKLRPDFPDYGATFARHQIAELSDDDHYRLLALCKEYGVTFLTTCFDLQRAYFLSKLGMDSIKVASPDSTSFNLIDKLTDLFNHVIISTGMTTNEEVEKLIDHVSNKNVTILHCISLYPTPLDKVNLERMIWLREQGVKVGYSDHSMGVEAGMLAISLGAEILEKHITLSRYIPGKDQAMSTLPEEFKELVEWSKLVESMRGTANPGLSEAENSVRKIYVGKWGDNS